MTLAKGVVAMLVPHAQLRRCCIVELSLLHCRVVVVALLSRCCCIVDVVVDALFNEVK